MIYKKEFIDYISENLGNVKYVANNIVVPCPWCDVNPNRSKNHLYISTDAPIFNCFRAGCEARGTIQKLVKKIEGSDISDRFINKEKLDELKKNKIIESKTKKHHTEYKIPEISRGQFPAKELYIKKRLKFYLEPFEVKGLIFDVYNFLKINRIEPNDSLKKLKDFLHSNFIGFISEHHNYISFRNINSKSSFRFYKLHLQNSSFLDYFKLNGTKKNSNSIVLSEGVFDIYTEYLFNTLNLRNSVKLYASVQSNSFTSLIKSIAFHEQVFRQNVIILSDYGVDLEYFKNLKRYNSHVIDNIDVYYNKMGKDFNSTIPIAERFCL